MLRKDRATNFGVHWKKLCDVRDVSEREEEKRSISALDGGSGRERKQEWRDTSLYEGKKRFTDPQKNQLGAEGRGGTENE